MLRSENMNALEVEPGLPSEPEKKQEQSNEWQKKE